MKEYKHDNGELAEKIAVSYNGRRISDGLNKHDAVKSIAGEYDISQKKVRELLNYAEDGGRYIHSRGIKGKIADAIYGMREEGARASLIAETLGISESSVYRHSKSKYEPAEPVQNAEPVRAVSANPYIPFTPFEPARIASENPKILHFEDYHKAEAERLRAAVGDETAPDREIYASAKKGKPEGDAQENELSKLGEQLVDEGDITPATGSPSPRAFNSEGDADGDAEGDARASFSRDKKKSLWRKAGEYAVAGVLGAAIFAGVFGGYKVVDREDAHARAEIVASASAERIADNDKKINAGNKRVNSLEAKVKEIDEVKTEFGRVNSTIGEIKTEVGRTNSAIGEIKTEVGKIQESIITYSKGKFEELGSKLYGVGQRIGNLEQKVGSLEEKATQKAVEPVMAPEPEASANSTPESSVKANVSKEVKEEIPEENVKGYFETRFGSISGESEGVEGAVSAGVDYGGNNLKFDSIYKAIDGNLQSGEDLGRITSGVSLKGGNDSLEVKVNSAKVNEEINGSSRSVTDNNEAVFYRVSENSNWNQDSERNLNSVEVKSKGEKFDFSFAYTSDVKETGNKNTTNVDVTFPDNPELQPINIVSNVEAETEVDEQTIRGEASYKFGAFEPGVIARNKTIYIDSSADINGQPAIDEDYKLDITSLGAFLGFENEKLRGRVLAMRNSGDGIDSDLRNEGAANIVFPMGDNKAFGFGYIRANGENRGSALAYFGGTSTDNPQNLEELLRTRESNDLFPEGSLDEQKSLELRRILMDLGRKGYVISGEKGEGDNLSIEGAMPLKFIHGASIAGGYTESKQGNSYFIEAEKPLTESLSIGIYGEGEHDDEEGNSHTIGVRIGGKF
jgi:hypothetical protein